jgi:NAD(P)-dependent dehydrogenase (short-subunit alcohol dehydrogenase family)
MEDKIRERRPSSPYYSAQLLGYNASESTLNMLTVQLSEELRNTPHVTNSVSPGCVKTDLTGGNGFPNSDPSSEDASPIRLARR